MRRMGTVERICAFAMAGACAVAAQNAITSIVSPTEGETFRVGDTMKIEWTVDEAALSKGIVVEISFDGGKKYYQLSPGEAMSNDTREMTWVIPDSVEVLDAEVFEMVNLATVSDEVVLFVYEYDLEGLTSGTVKILPEAPPATGGDPESSDDGGCGRGAGLALLPLLALRLRSLLPRWRRKDRKRR